MLSVERALTDPALFLSGLDLKTETAQFCEVALNQLDSRPCDNPQFSLDLDELAQHIERQALPERTSHYIFMTDFCGSTLLANALGSLDQVFQYGERGALVHLAMARSDRSVPPRQDWKQLQATVLHCQAKTAHSGQIALFKEWGAANFIIREQLEADPRSRAVFLYSTLEEYLTAALKEPRRRRLAQNRVQQDFNHIESLAPFRGLLKVGIPDHEACALHWLTLMYQYLSCDYGRLPGLRALRSSEFFERPEEALAASAAHFGLSVGPGELEQIVSSSIFGTYSKSQQRRPYSMAERAATVRTARATHGDEIDAGLRFAEQLLLANPIPDRLEVDLLASRARAGTGRRSARYTRRRERGSQ